MKTNKIKFKNLLKKVLDWGLPLLLVALLVFPSFRLTLTSTVQRGLLELGLFGTSSNLPDDTLLQQDLVFRNSEGQLIRSSELDHDFIFVNFWATWCPPCIAELPSINQLWQDAGATTAFVLVSMDEDFSKATSFMQKKGYQMPIYEPVSIPGQMQANSIPRTYIINRKSGEIIYSRNGMADYDGETFRRMLGVN